MNSFSFLILPSIRALPLCSGFLRSASTMFDLEWRGRRVALKANNGKYICTKKNGQLAAVSDRVGESYVWILKVKLPVGFISEAQSF